MAAIGAAVGVSCLLGYAVYALSRPAPPESVPAETKTKSGKRLKKRKGASLRGSGTTAKSSASSVDPFTQALNVCDLDNEELGKLSAEAKQQAFYALLVKGEMLLKDKKPEALERAVGYFLKAVAIVPNPTEVIMAYEQTLPAAVFQRIISELQVDSQRKAAAYFERITPESGAVRFVEMEGAPLATGKPAGRLWTATAAEDIEDETIVMSEEADVALATVNLTDACDYCFARLNAQDNTAVSIADLRYCSLFCAERARSSYAKYIEGLEGTAAYAYQQLILLTRETRTYAPLLLLRHVASLLEDELQRQKTPDSGRIGLFSHYDHLRPAYRAVRDSDRAEAMLIRTILQPSNGDVGDFLTDEIYVAMKSTVMYNCIGLPASETVAPATEAETVVPVVPVKESEEDIPVADVSISPDVEGQESGMSKGPSIEAKVKVLEPVRVAGSSYQAAFLGLYHTLAHVAHSCEPNCVLVPDAQIPRRLRLISRRSIQKGERLTIFYPAGSAQTFEDKTARRLTIERDFHVICDCSACV